MELLSQTFTRKIVPDSLRAIPVNIKNINSLLWTTSITGLRGGLGEIISPKENKNYEYYAEML